MKKVLILCIISFLSSNCAFADYNPINRIETIDEARIRHSSENYRIYKNNHYQAPLGGYPEKLGDPQPQGTLRPGYSNSSLNSDYSTKNNYGFLY